MSARPYMHLYISDYLGDTAHLTTEQHGAYLLILMSMWKAGGSLPNDPAVLASAAKVDVRRWASFGKVLMPFFAFNDDGTVTQKRLETEYRKASDFIAKQKAKSAQGVVARSLARKGIYQPAGKPMDRPTGQPAGEPADNPRVNPVVNPSQIGDIFTKVEVLDPPVPSSEISVLQPLASLQRAIGARSLAAASEVVGSELPKDRSSRAVEALERNRASRRSA